MNDYQYTNLRNYVEEIASQLKQVLAEQKRTNELLAAQGKTKGATSEFVEGSEKPATKTAAKKK